MSAATAIQSKIKKAKSKWPSLVRQAGPWYVAFVVNIFIAGLFFNAAESVNVFKSIWFSLVTGSTTGFGDVLPDTIFGYIVAVYIILTSGFFDTMWKAMVLIVMIEEPNLYSHEEQEAQEAKTDLSLAIQLNPGVDPTTLPEYAAWQEALRVVELSEKKEN